MSTHAKPLSLFDANILRSAALAAFAKMSPHKLWRNPVMFATAKLAPFRFRSGGTPGMGRGYGDA